MMQQVENETKKKKRKKGAVNNIESEEMAWRES